jgi:alkylation response protein AidB-like acyl-CoA dehydrogenase
VRLIDDWDGFGQRRTGTGTTVFTDVAVSQDEVLSDTPYDADPVPTVQYASRQLYIHAVVAAILASIVDDGVALLHRTPGPTAAASPNRHHDCQRCPET